MYGKTGFFSSRRRSLNPAMYYKVVNKNGKLKNKILFDIFCSRNLILNEQTKYHMQKKSIILSMSFNIKKKYIIFTLIIFDILSTLRNIDFILICQSICVCQRGNRYNFVSITFCMNVNI